MFLVRIFVHFVFQSTSGLNCFLEAFSHKRGVIYL